jgi:plastocyanin
MKIDFTKLPVGGMVIGFILVALIVTFAAAFIDLDDDGGEELVVGSPTPDASPTPGASPTEPAGNVFTVLMVPVIAFNVDEIVLPASTEVTVVADNQETGIPHNWAAYMDDTGAELIEGSRTTICGAPCIEEVTFTTPPPGEYFFRCDVHPLTMVGTLITE